MMAARIAIEEIDIPGLRLRLFDADTTLPIYYLEHMS